MATTTKELRDSNEIEFRGYHGQAVMDGEIVEIVDWRRPYGIPYAILSDGREAHINCLARGTSQ